MTEEELYTSLGHVDHSKEKRLQMARLIVNSPELIKPLTAIMLKEELPISPKAAWALEFAVRQQQSLLFPVMDTFTRHIGKLRIASSIRPAAKICEDLVLAYFSETQDQTQTILETKHLERITTTCFDWLIGEYKVAAKAYAITSLFQLGKKFDWIHPELKIILEHNYNTESAAYKARARIVLGKMEKLKADV